jgi:hypothetical protein
VLEAAAAAGAPEELVGEADVAAHGAHGGAGHRRRTRTGMRVRVDRTVRRLGSWRPGIGRKRFAFARAAAAQIGARPDRKDDEALNTGPRARDVDGGGSRRDQIVGWAGGPR